MKKKYIFYLSQGLMLLAFAYSSEGRNLASIMVSIMALLLTLKENSINILKDKLFQLCIFIGLQIIALHFTNLLNEIPTLIFVMVLNTVFALLWSMNEYEDIEDVLRLDILVMAMLYLLNMIINNARFERLDMFVFIAIIFMPMIVAIIYKYSKESYASYDFDNNLN